MNQTSTSPSSSARAIALIDKARGLPASAIPALDLAIRLYMANVFFKSGLTKIRDWDTTLALFQNEYKVPVLSPQIAALMGTGGELVLPVLLAIGLAGRFSALGLFVVNIVAVMSFPDIAEAARQEHFYWGVLLLVTLLHGPGKWSLDAWLWPRLAQRRG